MKKIFLGGKYGSVIGNYALVDDKDYEWLSRWKWIASRENGHLYAFRTGLSQNKKRGPQLRMHRAILNAPKDKFVDHKNGNGLDNRRKNLRLCTQSQNQMNRGKTVKNTSGYKGVSWVKKDRRWKAQIKVHGKKLYLGQFKTKEEAAEAYKQAAKKYHGEFHSL